MRVAIVSPPIDISGGMKQKLLLGQALAGAGFAVDVVTPQSQLLTAFRYRGRSLHPDQATQEGPYDVAVVTWYETYDLARALAPRLVHFCQGYEGDLVHLQDRRPAIDAVYAQRLPTLVVSPHLVDRLASCFGTHAVVSPPLLDAAFTPRWGRRRPHRVPTILVHGIFEAAVKRVRPALEAVEILRTSRPARLDRISSFPRSDGEPLRHPGDRYFHRIHPAQVARLTARADLSLFTSEAGEGFGLPVLESLAAGTPVVAVRIPSLAVFEEAGVVTFSDNPEPQTLAQLMRSLLDDPAHWRRARRRGLAFAEKWRSGQEQRAAQAFLRLLHR